MLPADKFIIVEKNGKRSYFLRNVWEKLSKADRRGWKELYTEEHKTVPPVDVINFKDIQQEVKTAEPYLQEKVSEPPLGEMRNYLQSLGYRVSPNIGEKKLKERYYLEKQKADDKDKE